MIVGTVSLRNFRSYARLDVDLEPGIVLVVGANGAGKTNLLESVHVGTQGFSPRTRNDAQLLRFGETAGRVVLHGTRPGGVPIELQVTLRAGAAKEGKVNGAAVRAVEQLRNEVATLVFTPDRLAVVKAGPAVRRAYLDRATGRLLPSRAGVPAAYAVALAQRNAGLRRALLGHSSREALEPWTHRLAQLGAELVAARHDALALLEPEFATCAGELGLDEAGLGYEGEAPTADELNATLERDLERGHTGLGPHLHDVLIAAGTRELRLYGSQGEQRLAVLALLLAEAAVLTDRHGHPPLLLLDDVLSELDPERRRILAGRIAGRGQTLVTATTASALPVDPDQLLQVTPGRVRVA